ncbi:hypothetical protein AB0M36_08275 [Actinoplanes sp. NPDC051346]|uniref:hypothetical protein n=1 Tax=Actinoplanes sp. NPDC051346 TaxID=3155048 RepID=UPI003436D68B
MTEPIVDQVDGLSSIGRTQSRARSATVMRFIDEHRDRFAVALLLRVLNIAESA